MCVCLTLILFAVGQLGGSPPICITSDSSSNIFFPATPHGHGHSAVDALSTAAGVALYSEMEALQLSRSDNPFVRQSQDNLDAISLARKVVALLSIVGSERE